MFATGNFTRAPGARAAGIAMFDGTAWSSVGGHMQSDSSSYGQCIIVFDPDDAGPAPERLVVGGSIDSVAGVPVQNVAMFDGVSWAAMGGGIPSFPRGFAPFDPDGSGPEMKLLIASGGIISGEPGSPGYIYRWNGTDWAAFGPEFVSNSGPPRTMSLAAFDPDGPGPQPQQLVVGGYFDRVGTVLAKNIASFDGSVWRPLESGFTTGPGVLFTWDPSSDGRQVVLAGAGTRVVNGVPTSGIAMWNGSEWSGMGDSRNFAVGFTTFDGTLLAVGQFLNGGDQLVNAVARWTGKDWQVVAETSEERWAYCVGVLPAGEAHPDTLCIGGPFRSVGGLANAFFARLAWTTCCPADINADGMVMSDDFFAFLDVFMSETEEADFNGDKTVNSQDFFDFLGAFFSGC